MIPPRSPTGTDAHGQPVNRRFNKAPRLADRQGDELIAGERPNGG